MYASIGQGLVCFGGSHVHLGIFEEFIGNIPHVRQSVYAKDDLNVDATVRFKKAV
jgi:hypothetical protein